MGLEYEGTLELTEPQAHDLFERLEAQPGWRVVSRGARRVSFRFAGAPPGHFDEAFVLKARPDGSLYLLFNGAEAGQRAAVLQAITAAALALGLYGLRFEEA